MNPWPRLPAPFTAYIVAQIGKDTGRITHVDIFSEEQPSLGPEEFGLYLQVVVYKVEAASFEDAVSNALHWASKQHCKWLDAMIARWVRRGLRRHT